MNKALLVGLFALLAFAGTSQATVLLGIAQGGKGYLASNAVDFSWAGYNANCGVGAGGGAGLIQFAAYDWSTFNAAAGDTATLYVDAAGYYGRTDYTGTTLNVYRPLNAFSLPLPGANEDFPFSAPIILQGSDAPLQSVDITAFATAWAGGAPSSGLMFNAWDGAWDHGFGQLNVDGNPADSFIVVTSAPEPVTMSLLVVGGIGALLRRRK